MAYEGTPNKGKVAITGGKELRFDDLFDLSISALGKVWILADISETVLKFRPHNKLWHAKKGVPVGVILRAWRRQKGLSQAQAVDELGMSISLIQKVEQGRRRLSSVKLSQILASLDRPIYVSAGRRGMVKIEKPRE